MIVLRDAGLKEISRDCERNEILLSQTTTYLLTVRSDFAFPLKPRHSGDRQKQSDTNSVRSAASTCVPVSADEFARCEDIFFPPTLITIKTIASFIAIFTLRFKDSNL